MKILGIVGSKRKKGNTAQLMEEALNAAKKLGVETDIVYLGDYNFQGCIGCEGCKKNYHCVLKDDMQKIYPKVIEADGLILGSPTYFYNITAMTKAFIERLYCYEVFDDSDRSVWMSVHEALGGKLATTIAICEQKDEKDMGVTSKVMDMSLESLGYRIVSSVKVLELYEAGAAKGSTKAIEQCRIAGEKLAKTLSLKNKILKSMKD